MTRDVRDCALMMNAVSGYDERDGTTLNVDAEDYLSYLANDVKGMRFGVPREFLGEGTDDGVSKAVWRCVNSLESMGARWDEVSLPSVRYALPAYYMIAMSEASSNLARYDGIDTAQRGGCGARLVVFIL
jgi:aspartyl-tRNA(Asn)/glutamyl-tRNA(Gln) amidotransferase subunit A